MATEEQGQTWLTENRDHREVTLSKPIRADGKDIMTLRIREPVVADFERMPVENFEMPALFIRHVLAKCTSVPESAIRLLTMGDFMACGAALADMGFSLNDAYGFLVQQMRSALETGRIGSFSLQQGVTSGNENSG